LIETAILAILIGLVCLASGIGGLLSPQDWLEMFDEFERSPGLTLTIAFIAILFGAFIILFHRSWSGAPAVAVSLIGWATFLEGLMLLGLPRLYIRLVRRLLVYARAWAIFALLLGAWLLAAGISARSPAFD
jgi:uncharacterized protein YjeT (DUF2065 family)